MKKGPWYSCEKYQPVSACAVRGWADISRYLKIFQRTILLQESVHSMDP